MTRLWLLGLLFAAGPTPPQARAVEKQARVVEKSAARLVSLAQLSAEAGRPVAMTPLTAEAALLAKEMERLEERLAELGAAAPGE